MPGGAQRASPLSPPRVAAQVEERKAAEQKEMSAEQAAAAARRGEIDARNAVLAEKLEEVRAVRQADPRHEHGSLARNNASRRKPGKQKKMQRLLARTGSKLRLDERRRRGLSC